MSKHEERQILHLAELASEQDCESKRVLFETWCNKKGISVSKNQSMPSRYFVYHNHNTRQLWKLWKQIIAELEQAERT